MSLKEKIKALFEAEKGRYISGEDIASRLNVSRNSVFKAVSSLRDEGYEIYAVTGKGYVMAENTDILSESSVRRHLGELSDRFDIEVMTSVDSTNNYLKKKAAAGAKSGTVVICEHQSAGRGRMNRVFFSPQSTGVYLSILLRPDLDAEDAMLITPMSAVAASMAIDAVSGIKSSIKWVNDVYIDGKKVCGILTEAGFDMENGKMDYVIIGTGVNVFEPEGGFPDEIKDRAASVFKQQKFDIRNRLAAEIIKNTAYFMDNFREKLFVEQYKSRSFIIGKTVTVIDKGENYEAEITGIDDFCRLIVKDENGNEIKLSTGEISIKL